VIGTPKPCTQEGYCSSWDECPYGHDVRKCVAAMEPDDDDLEID